MKRMITMIVLALGLLFCIGFANAERLEESQGKEVQLSHEEWKKLSVFMSNFSEAFLEPFKENQISEEQLIEFGVRHNLWNNPNLFKDTGDSEYHGYKKIQAKYVVASVEKYFGKKIATHKSTAECRYKDGYYTIQVGDGEVTRFAQLTKLIDIDDGYYIAYTTEYGESSAGFSGDEYGSPEEWKKYEADEIIPEFSGKMRAVIKKVTEKGRSRYILIEYLRIDK